jgi:hypothetical protein
LDITFLVNFQREKNKKEFEVPGRILSWNHLNHEIGLYKLYIGTQNGVYGSTI